jgi:hypothetical protein
MAYRDDFRSIEQNVWWTLPRLIFAMILGIVVLYGVGFLVTGGDLAIYTFWAPKRANAERQVFVNTNSYVQGKTDYLSRLRYEYQSTKDERQKSALRSLIISESSNVDITKLPTDLQGFITGIKEGNNGQF